MAEGRLLTKAWKCWACGAVLGMTDCNGRLWLLAPAVRLAQLFVNVVRVECAAPACQAVNRWYRADYLPAKREAAGKK